MEDFRPPFNKKIYLIGMNNFKKSRIRIPKDPSTAVPK